MPNILQIVLDFSQRFAISDRLSSSYLTLRLGFLDLVVLCLDFLSVQSQKALSAPW